MSLAALAIAASLAQPPPPACDSVPACVAELRRVADESEGITREEVAVAEAIEALGSEAVDALVELLDDPQEKVRDLAGYTMRGMGPFETRHLEPIRRALFAGNGWVAPALAAIGTPEALDVATQRFFATRGREGSGLSSFGTQAVPPLVDLFRCRGTCDDDLLIAAGKVLADMEEAADAAEPLGQVAADESRPVEDRARVLQVLGWLGERGRGALPEILPLTRGDAPTVLRQAARQAVVRIGGADTVEVLAAALAERERRIETLRDIASHGPSVRAVGPHVEALLAADEPDVRIAAGRTLGFIGYAESASALAAALQDPADWRLVYVAAEALGRLLAPAGKDALAVTGAQNWYPPVLDAARLAVARIDGLEPPPELRDRYFSAAFFDLDSVPAAHGSCDATRSSPRMQRTERRFRSTDEPALAKRLTYDVPAEGRRGPFVPGVGLRVSGGWLLGSDHGEWGGELVFRSDAGRVTVVLPGNIADIQVVGRDTIVAVGGLAHLTSDSGAVYRVERDEKRSWRAERWRELPGAPETSWPIAGNQLLIVARGGTVVLAPDGTMALAPCHAGVKD